jgi:hypothetical protein
MQEIIELLAEGIKGAIELADILWDRPAAGKASQRISDPPPDSWKHAVQPPRSSDTAP